MKKVREVIAYKDYFEKFLLSLDEKVQNKIYKVIEIIETFEMVPKQYLKAIKDSKGLYEARIKLGKNIRRVFCFFDEEKLIVLLTGFQKKTQKTPKKEINRAIKLMNEYYQEKNKQNEN